MQHPYKTHMTNLLGEEKSPYLQQHKDNPIAWQAWGEEAFRRAREENKPIFLSIGYSTCHWCHVMAHESFEDQEVADVLNGNFVSIKVDREEHPDVDQVYMTALQTLSGGGGWPLSAWLMPDGKPFFAGTYFPKPHFIQLLRRIHEIWQQEPDKIRIDSERLLETVRQLGRAPEGSVPQAEQEEFLAAYISHFQHHFDERNGGFGGAPKFPQTMNLMLMMRQDFTTGLRQAEAIVTTTLMHMVRGGIYDQLHGGFHRYSVDEEWIVPHFEKMLYDQALITVTLLEAYQLYGEKDFARAARETLDYVLREMTHAHGGFFSAQDADSLNPQTGEKEEGWFCTYDYEELRQSLTEDELLEAERVFGVTAKGNFEGRSILYRRDGEASAHLREKLKKLRATRPQPHLDDKVIVAWNGWMVWAMAKAARSLNEPRFLTAAQKAMTFLHENLWREGRLHRYWREDESRGAGTSEDYASLIHACLELYQADFDPRWAKWAMQLQETLDAKFWDEQEGLYFSNDGQSTLLPLRLKEQYDGVHPCANSMAALNLSRLYLLVGDVRLLSHYQRINAALFPRFREFPSTLPFLGIAADFHLRDARAAVLCGEGWVSELPREFQPNILWARDGWPVTHGKVSPTPAVYLCSADRCLDPIGSLENFRKFIRR